MHSDNSGDKVLGLEVVTQISEVMMSPIYMVLQSMHAKSSSALLYILPSTEIQVNTRFISKCHTFTSQYQTYATMPCTCQPSIRLVLPWHTLAKLIQDWYQHAIAVQENTWMVADWWLLVSTCKYYKTIPQHPRFVRFCWWHTVYALQPQLPSWVMAYLHAHLLLSP